MPLVSIPRRDFIGFRAYTKGYCNLTEVSIPRRDFIGFRAKVFTFPEKSNMFQSLEGILSDLEASKQVKLPDYGNLFQSLEGILSDLEGSFGNAPVEVVLGVSIPRRDFIGFRE